MAVIGRLLLLVFAYALACVAASFVFTVGSLNPGWDEWAAAGLPPAAVWAIVAVGAPIIGVVAFLPAAVMVAITESLAWRSAVVYAAIGGALALLLSLGFDVPADGSEPETGALLINERQLLAAAGIAGGLVYWLFAGRSAGSWT